MIAGRRDYVESFFDTSTDYASTRRQRCALNSGARSFRLRAQSAGSALMDERMREGIPMDAWSGRVVRMTRGIWLPLIAVAGALLAACSGEGDGSVGVGSGQDPDPVAPDFPIAYTKG